MKEGSYIILIYVFLWVLFFLFLRKKNKTIGMSMIIVLTYIIYGFFSLLLYNDSDIWANYTIRVFPFVYLFVMLILSLLPVIQYDQGKIQHIAPPDGTILNSFSVFFILVTIIVAPNYLSNITDGLYRLITDVSGGADLYSESHSNGVASRTIMDVPYFLYSMFSYVGVLVFFYYLTINKTNKWILIGFIFAMAISILAPIAKGLRTDTIMMLFAILAAFVLLKPWIPDKRKKVLLIIGSVGLGIVVVLVALLTISRFGDSNSGVEGSLESYIGQANLYFNQYGLNAGGIRYGDRTCRVFKELLGFSNVPDGVLSRRFKYYDLLIDDYYFYTFVGDFTIDFGPIVAFLIFVFASFFFLRYTKVNKGIISFSQLIILYLAVLIPLQGGMYLFNYSDGEYVS